MEKKKKKASKKKSSQPHLAELLEGKKFFTIYKQGRKWAAKTLSIKDDDVVIDTIHSGGLRYTLALFNRAVKEYLRKVVK